MNSETYICGNNDVIIKQMLNLAQSRDFQKNQAIKHQLNYYYSAASQKIGIYADS